MKEVHFSSTWANVVLLLICLVAVNVTAFFIPLRFDLTEESLYTISDGSREIIKNLKVADQQYIRDGLEELEIQIVKTPKDYDEYKYMTGEQAIEFLQSLSDGKTKAFVKEED